MVWVPVTMLLLGLALFGGGAGWDMRLVYAASSLITYLAGLASWCAGRPALFAAVLLAGAVGFDAGTSALIVKTSFADRAPFLHAIWMLFFGALCIGTSKASGLFNRYLASARRR